MSSKIPKVMLVMKPVDGGRAMIGLIECPCCGETHYTTQIQCGERLVFCGVNAERPDGHSRILVERIL
jgi:hypothetical protein